MIVLNGFVKIHRKLIQWGWYQDNVVKGVFLHLLLTASFKDSPWRGRIIHAGQVVIGSQRMADDLGFTRQQVRTALTKLESTGEITIESTNKYTIVTVVNWEEYQVLETDTKIQVYKQNEQPTKKDDILSNNIECSKNITSKITNKKEPENIDNIGLFESDINLTTNTLTNHQPTNNQQITNKQPHRKNVKEYKEGKEIYIERSAPIESFFESVWKLYPEKKGKSKVSQKTKQALYELGYEKVKECIDRYVNDKPDWKQYQHGSTFFNGGYLDYLEEAETEPAQDTSMPKEGNRVWQ